MDWYATIHVEKVSKSVRDETQGSFAMDQTGRDWTAQCTVLPARWLSSETSCFYLVAVADGLNGESS